MDVLHFFESDYIDHLFQEIQHLDELIAKCTADSAEFPDGFPEELQAEKEMLQDEIAILEGHRIF